MTDTARLAVPADAAAIDRTLVEAFADDPFISWIFPAPDGRAAPESNAAFMAAERANLAGHGHTYVVDDRAAALWTPPGIEADMTPIGEVMAVHAPAERLARAGEVFMEMAALHPAEPHFYLSMIGTRDDSRGLGLGRRLLERVLTICDTDGFPAHLESSNGRNVGLYERHGFEVRGEFEVAPGVVLRPMTRPTR